MMKCLIYTTDITGEILRNVQNAIQSVNEILFVMQGVAEVMTAKFYVKL